MRIKKIQTNKKRFLDLLLLADEQESMIDRYLQRGELFALFDEDLKSACVVTKEGPGIVELKNIATYEAFQGKGYGKRLLQYILDYYRKDFSTLYVGTGDQSSVRTFYDHLGFCYSHRVANFFTDHYSRPIFEGGKQLVDMVYYKIELCNNVKTEQLGKR